jgi:nucleoside-diphosphate-sugar epimerase
MTPPAKHPADKQTSDKGLTVAVTGPTGEIGRSLLAALERSDQVTRVLGMARRPFDPAAHGWSKVEYRRGDVLDRASVDALVAEADVVVHLAFIIFGDREQTRTINLDGTRNVFEAAVAAGTRRLVYTSSVAAYGFHPENPEVLTEDVEPRGTDDFYYSAQKAELEALLHELVDGTDIEQYIFRPCVVGGSDAPALINDVVKRFQLGGRLPVERDLLRILPGMSPVIPETGNPMQLVHHDDCADALVAAIEGRGAPGVYNLAANGTITMTDVARELGWRTIPMPGLAVKVAAGLVKQLGSLLPQELAWVNIARQPVTMDTTKAQRELGWHPRHDADATLSATIAGAKAAGIV